MFLYLYIFKKFPNQKRAKLPVFFYIQNSWVNFSFNRKVTKEISHVLVAGAKTSLFAKNSRCTFSAEKARLKFF